MYWYNEGMKKQHKTLVLIFIVLAAMLVAVWWWFPLTGGHGNATDPGIDSYIAWEEADRCLRLDVADTPQLRRQGLGGRDGLAENQGMIFLYGVSGEYGYWMKGMNFPIDMIWLNAEDEIVTIKTSVPPDTYPEVFYPTESARKIIEVSAGVAAELNLEVGDQLNLSTPTSTPTVDCAML